MKTLKQIQEENRKFIIMANNPTAKTYDEALEMELKSVGCKFEYDGGSREAISIGEQFDGYISIQSWDDMIISKEDITKIIGKPLTLNRVLNALKGRWSGFFVDNIFLPSENNSAYAKINLLNTGDEIISLNWDLTKETLEEQSEETQRKINESI